MKLMLIDGNSIVNRAYYGIRMLNAPDGTPTNGIYGFITILQRLLDEEKPDCLCAAFDLHAPTFRHLAFDGYKAQRKGMPEELQVQMPLLKRTLDAMGIARVELEGFEADDILGTLSRRWEETGGECVIVTGDKDSFQLITAKTRVLHVKTRMGKTETISYTPERFFEEYGFEPKKIIDLKALMGDTSDNIPGVKGIGEKTALELVRTFGGLRELYEKFETSDLKPGVKSKLREGKQQAEMSYELATIVTDAPVVFDLEKTRWSYDFRPELYSVFIELGFTKFIERYKLSPAPEERETSDLKSVTPRIIKTEDDLAAADAAIAGTHCGVWLSREERSLTFYTESDGRVLCFVLGEEYEGDGAAAAERLLGCTPEAAGHNVKDVLRLLDTAGVGSANFAFDTALAAYLLDATAGSYEPERLCVQYCGYSPKRRDEDENGQLSLLDAAGKSYDCSAAMAQAVFLLSETLASKLTELKMDRLFYDIELPLCRVLADMEEKGFFVDKRALSDFGESLTDGISTLEERIWSEAGDRFNINSPKQLGTVLFEKLMLPAGKKTKTGWSTNADILEKLRGKHPIIQDILDYRMLTKLKSTYADGLLKVIAPDGRIHTSFQMTVTATGRLSSTEPNLQNIPVRRELGSQVRKMFVAPEGKVLVDADYSQIELRLLAHISGDENMINAFLSGEDIHAVTASQVFGVPLSEVTPIQRSRAKAVNFGIVYGISAWSLAQDIGVSQAEAKAYMDAYLEKYHGVREYMKSVTEKARADGYVETLFGRRRALPELKSSNFAMRSFGERVALNMPIQGTAADIIKLAMVRVDRRLRAEGLKSRLVLQVHDELIAECPEQEAEKVKNILCEEMENTVNYSVPLTAQAGIGTSWAEAH